MEQNQQPQPPVFKQPLPSPQPQQAPQPQPPPMPQYQPRVTASPMMSPVESVVTCLKKFFDFKGRARRSEFWWYILFYYIVSTAFSWMGNFVPVLSVVGLVISTALFIPQFSAVTRRMHDTNHSGWWIFVIFVLVVFYIVSLVALLAPLGINMLEITDPMAMATEMVDVVQAHPVLATVMSFSSLLSMILLIVTLVFAIKDSDWKENKYGPSPKYQ